jgi:hypothetical protein
MGSRLWESAFPLPVLTRDSLARTEFYLIEGVPSGSCTLTIRSETGEYRAVTAIVDIATGATTTKDIVLTAAQMGTVTFNVRVPNDTPALAVPRLYGDSYRLGMVENVGFIVAEPTRPIDMTAAGGNLWTFSAELGNGTCVTYLYTIGYFSRNNEKASNGAIVTRSLCVNGSTTVNDTVAAWKTSQQVTRQPRSTVRSQRGPAAHRARARVRRVS